MLLTEFNASVDISDLDEDGVLHVCEDVDIARLLVSHGADALKKNSNGLLAVQVAFAEGWNEVVEYLRGKSCDLFVYAYMDYTFMQSSLH